MIFVLVQSQFQLFQIESTSLQESLGWSSFDDMKEHEHFLGLLTN